MCISTASRYSRLKIFIRTELDALYQHAELRVETRLSQVTRHHQVQVALFDAQGECVARSQALHTGQRVVDEKEHGTIKPNTV